MEIKRQNDITRTKVTEFFKTYKTFCDENSVIVRHDNTVFTNTQLQTYIKQVITRYEKLGYPTWIRSFKMVAPDWFSYGLDLFFVEDYELKSIPIFLPTPTEIVTMKIDKQYTALSKSELIKNKK